jgi:hypothetical protein
MTSGYGPPPGGLPADHAPGDLSPMISSVHTRALADLRGAYLAGNPDALLDAMNDPQQRLYQRAVIGQALAPARGVLLAEGEGVEREVPGLVARWLDDPEGAATQDDLAYASGLLLDQTMNPALPVRCQRVLAYFLAHAVFLTPAMAGVAALHIIDNVKRLWGVPAGQTVAQTGEAARRWQVEAAWAILQGREPPPLENFL